MHLQRFNSDLITKSELKEYFIAYFEQQILKTAKEGKPVEALAQALNHIEGAFIQLSIDFDVKPESTTQENPAR
jgi:hypothetical protein